MTQEEKARAYDEALERARKYMAKGYYVLMPEIFPELRESEDERVRMELIEYLRGDLDDITTDDTDRWISWLEKQKDAFENGRQLGIMQEQARQELEWTDEKQKEQKPAWSEEDELMRTAVIQTLKMFGGRGTTEMQIDWLKSLRPSWKPSEEQMEELWNVISYIERPSSNFLGVPALLESLYEQLKKL